MLLARVGLEKHGASPALGEGFDLTYAKRPVSLILRGGGVLLKIGDGPTRQVT